MLEAVKIVVSYHPFRCADHCLGFLIPGFIDAHAHWSGMSNPIPAKSWELQTFLAYGVTTMHK